MDCLALTPPPLLTHTLTSVVRMCEANVLAVEKAPKPRAPRKTWCSAAKAGTRGYKWSRIISHFHSCLPVNVSHSGEEYVALHRHYGCGQRWPAPDPSLTNEFPLISSKPREPCHKKPCYRVGLIFELGPCPQSLPAVCCGWISGQPYLLLWQLCLFLSKLFSLSITESTICPFFLCPSPSFSPCPFVDGWWWWWILMLMSISSLQKFFTVLILLPCLFFLVFHPISLNLVLFFSLGLFFPVWPGPGHPHPQCMYYYLSFFFISLHNGNILPLLAVLHHSSCMWMLTQRGFFCSQVKFYTPSLEIIWLSRVGFVLLALHSHSW